MSTKAMGKSAQAEKPVKAFAKVESSKKKDAPLKADKKAAAKAVEPTVEPEVPAIDPDELEEQEDEAAAANSGSSSNAAALAAASGPTEMSASFKNFRHHPDMENFYRFIYENDLRHEALAIIDQIMVEKQQRKVVKTAKTQSH